MRSISLTGTGSESGKRIVPLLIVVRRQRVLERGDQPIARRIDRVVLAPAREVDYRTAVLLECGDPGQIVSSAPGTALRIVLLTRVSRVCTALGSDAMYLSTALRSLFAIFIRYPAFRLCQQRGELVELVHRFAHTVLHARRDDHVAHSPSTDRANARRHASCRRAPRR